MKKRKRRVIKIRKQNLKKHVHVVLIKDVEGVWVKMILKQKMIKNNQKIIKMKNNQLKKPAPVPEIKDVENVLNFTKKKKM